MISFIILCVISVMGLIGLSLLMAFSGVPFLVAILILWPLGFMIGWFVLAPMLEDWIDNV